MKKTMKTFIYIILSIMLLSLCTISALAEASQTISIPETGGIGTTILYVIGGILVFGTGILLVSKKMMSSNHNHNEEITDDIDDAIEDDE